MPRTKEKENYRARLKAVGLRHTLPRERILSYLDRKNVHPTPEELYQGLKKRGYDIGLSTVYLNLHVLREHGLLYEFKDPKGYTRYDGYNEPHVHLVCLSCGKVEDLLLKNLPELDVNPAMQAAAERTGWALEASAWNSGGSARAAKSSRSRPGPGGLPGPRFYTPPRQVPRRGFRPQRGFPIAPFGNPRLKLSAPALISQHGIPEIGPGGSSCGAPTAAFAAVGYLKCGHLACAGTGWDHKASATFRRVRTPKPVPPSGPRAWAFLAKAGPAMSRWTRGTCTNSAKKRAAVMAPP